MADTYNVDFGIGSRIHLLLASKLVGPLGVKYTLEQFYILHPKEKIQSIFLSLENGEVYLRHDALLFNRPNTELFFLFMLGIAKSMAELQEDSSFESLSKVESIGGGIPIISRESNEEDAKIKELLSKRLDENPIDLVSVLRTFQVRHEKSEAQSGDSLSAFLKSDHPAIALYTEIAENELRAVSEEDKATAKIFQDAIGVIIKRTTEEILSPDMTASEYLELSKTLNSIKQFAPMYLNAAGENLYIYLAQVYKLLFRFVLTQCELIEGLDHNKRLKDWKSGSQLNKNVLTYTEYSKLLEAGKLFANYAETKQK